MFRDSEIAKRISSQYGVKNVVLVKHERRHESAEHKALIDRSVELFKDAGFRVCQMPVGVFGVRAISDYFVVKDDGFYFVECLTRHGLNIKVYLRKARLMDYAPVYVIVPTGLDLGELSDYPFLIQIDVSDVTNKS